LKPFVHSSYKEHSYNVWCNIFLTIYDFWVEEIWLIDWDLMPT
jgi:hypothetical protein